MNVGYPNGICLVHMLPRESDMPVLVKIAEKVKATGAKGHYCKRVSKDEKSDRIDSDESEKG